ncbi:MAG: bifunctional DNA-formamidopyrimidine glycosylase/DNA-(apurinic or apyrimidinic site) lyase [Chloroflexi bacterium]|nr:bifunctional DNA-formamidopyrimidine glycosylase/DNA-(apurinic or apyrimidinic site) lyase [Chloroflexota bacterium]
MPELPEVETVVRGLQGENLPGREIISAESTWPRQIVTPSPDEFLHRIRGQVVESLSRRAKYIIVKLNRDYLIIHLKMTGRLYMAPVGDEAGPYLRARFRFDDGRELRFSDMRKFGRLYLAESLDLIESKLGPEPLSDDFTEDYLRRELARRKAVLKPLLMNQAFLAGVGNIYADEALWSARIDPRRKADTLEGDEVKRLYDAIRSVLRLGIDHEGASVNWYRKANGERGEHQDYLNAYDQTGKPCQRCGNPIEKIRLAQRGTHYCPVCQH